MVETYEVGNCTVCITKDGQYLVVEPPLTSEAYAAYSEMMEQLYYSLEPISRSDDPIRYIEDHLWKEAERCARTDFLAENFVGLRYYLVRDILGYGILDVLMRDENVEEITVERFDRNVGIIHRRHSEFGIMNSNICFESIGQMDSYIQRTVQKTGSIVTTAMPIMSTMTKEGDRVTVTYGGEVSLPGPTINIRKFTRRPLAMVDLLRLGTLNELIAAYLWMLIDAKSFGLLVGETGSGKTTVANAVIGLSNPRWKIVTVEETPELKIPHYRWVRLITRTSSSITQQSFDINVMDLIRASLRMRPDFEIVGEVRGREAQYLFQSAATGHGGLTTFHASSAESALSRLGSEPINIGAGEQMLLWYIAHVTRIKDPQRRIMRKVVSIKEVGAQNGRISLHEVFAFDQKTDRYNIETLDELLQRSVRVGDAAAFLNVDARDDLQKRIEFLTGHGADERLQDAIARFYA